MATGEEKAFAVAKSKFKKAKAKLKEYMEEGETELIPAAIEKVEKKWNEFDDLFNEKICSENSENDEELEKDFSKLEREKDKIISEARNMIEPNVKTGAKSKTRTDGRRNQQKPGKVKWSDITKRKDNRPPGKGSLCVHDVP